MRDGKRAHGAINCGSPANDAGVLELFQPIGQDVGRDAGQALAQIGEAVWADEQIAHDEQRPTLADQLEGARQAAELPVRPRGHGLHSRGNLP